MVEADNLDPTIDSKFWPTSVSHLEKPYTGTHDEHIVVAEISSDPINGFSGIRQLYTALIPLAEVDRVLAEPGGIGWQVESWGPLPEVTAEHKWDGRFWIRGMTLEDRYEPLVHGWSYHDRVVMLPDNSFLMCYGLVPRIVSNEIHWDDPSAPVYDVVKVRPLSIYEVPNKYSRAEVRIARDYLEDYASLKRCALVAVFFEERFSHDLVDIAKVLGSAKWWGKKLPGRRLEVKRLDRPINGANQFTQVWGCQLILKPNDRPISEPKELLLQWPDSTGVLTSADLQGFDPLDLVYVSDEVLREWQGQDEFTIYPQSGSVSYNGWWSTGQTFRAGRNHLAINLHNLYEGTPHYVIKHFHKFAVPEKTVESDRHEYGERHIGLLAEDVITSFLNLIKSLTTLADRLGLLLDEEDFFCGFTDQEVRYYGWWTRPELKELGYIVSLTITQDLFLDRCVLLYQLFERIKPGPLKQVLQQLGMVKADFVALGETTLVEALGRNLSIRNLSKIIWT